MTGERSLTIRRTTGTRAGWGVADQVLSSATNFGLVIVVARSVSAIDFGAFALAMVGYALAVGLVRSITAEPFAIVYSGVPAPRSRDAASRCVSAGLVASVVAAVAVVAVGLGLGGATGRALWIVGLLLAPLLVQDVLRALAIAIGRPRVAFASDATWAIVQFSGFALLSGHLGLGTALLLWGAGGGTGLVVAMVLLRTTPVPSGTRAWHRETRTLWPRLSVEFLAWNAGWQVSLVVVSVLVGLSAVGALRGALTLVGPVTVLFLAVPLVAVPELARLVGRDARALLRAADFLSFGLIVTACIWGGALLVIPDELGERVLGATWGGAQELVPAIIVFTIATGAILGSLTGLRVLAAARESLIARVATAVSLLIAATIAAAIADVEAAAWALAAVNVGAAGLWWLVLRWAARRRTGSDS